MTFDADKTARQIAFGNITMSEAKKDLKGAQKAALTKAIKKREEIEAQREADTKDMLEWYDSLSEEDQYKYLMGK